MSNFGMAHRDELEKTIGETVAQINNEHALVISLITVLNRLTEIGRETTVNRNEYDEMYIVVGGEWRITFDEDSGQWYTTDIRV